MIPNPFEVVEHRRQHIGCEVESSHDRSQFPFLLKQLEISCDQDASTEEAEYYAYKFEVSVDLMLLDSLAHTY